MHISFYICLNTIVLEYYSKQMNRPIQYIALTVYPYNIFNILYIIGARRAEMEEPNYSIFEATFDPNELKKEMMKMKINKAADDDGGEYIEKSEDDVAKEMSAYWKTQSQAEALAGPATVDNALVHRKISYMIRSLLPHTLEADWSLIETTMTKNGQQSGYKLYLPPSPPLYVICGKSHVENLAKISHQATDKDVMTHSQRTAFVVFDNGTATWFKQWGQLFLASLTTELKNLYSVYTPEEYLPVLLLMSPFSWQIGYREEINYDGGRKTTIPWEHTMARNLIKATQMITAHIAGNPVINLALGWIDMPILPKFQVRCCRLNKIIKEVNFLLDPNIPSCRSWRTSLTADKFGDSMPVEVSSLTHLSFDISKYGKGDGKVVSHLSDQGSSVYLLSLWTGWGQGMRDRNASQDFNLCRPAISTPPYTQTSYFSEVQDLKELVASDTTSTENQMALDALQNYSIDVSSIKMNIRFQRKAEFTYNNAHMRPTSFLSERADKRSKKNAIYNKIHEIRNQKNSGSNNAGNGPGKWR